MKMMHAKNLLKKPNPFIRQKALKAAGRKRCSRLLKAITWIRVVNVYVGTYFFNTLFVILKFTLYAVCIKRFLNNSIEMCIGKKTRNDLHICSYNMSLTHKIIVKTPSLHCVLRNIRIGK
jgi:hypothetical protein